MLNIRILRLSSIECYNVKGTVSITYLYVGLSEEITVRLLGYLVTITLPKSPLKP